MREQYWIQKLDALEKMYSQLAYTLQLGFSGNALTEETLKALLMEKGVITETEFTEALGKQIKKINAEESKRVEDEKKKLVKPTAEETTVVDSSKKEVDKAVERKELKTIPKLGRNASCYCGSGKKFKKCCLEKKEEPKKEEPKKVVKEEPKIESVKSEQK